MTDHDLENLYGMLVGLREDGPELSRSRLLGAIDELLNYLEECLELRAVDTK